MQGLDRIGRKTIKKFFDKCIFHEKQCEKVWKQCNIYKELYGALCYDTFKSTEAERLLLYKLC
jgi:hypothetical protein